MRILVGENIPRCTVNALTADGHDVRDVRGTREQGADDDRLWSLAKDESRPLITTDKGFSIRRGESHSGLLVVRLRQPNRISIHVRVMQAISSRGEADWRGLTVVVRDRVQSEYRAAL